MESKNVHVMQWLRMVTALLAASLCLSAHARKAGPALIPFTLHQDNIVVSARLDSSPPLPFIFDSGLNKGSIVTLRTAAMLGMKPGSDVRLRDASGKHHGGGLTTVRTLRVGQALLTDQPVAILPVSASIVARSGKPPIAGFIGAPLMKHAVLCLDYRHKVMRRWPRAEFDDKGYVSVAMPLNRDLATIRVQIDGLAATLAVDTGNNGGVELFPSFVRANDLLERYPDLHAMGGVSGGGNHFRILGGTARSVKVGPQIALGNVSLMLIAQSFDPAWGIDGLAGYKLLSRLDPCLDRDGQRMYLPLSDSDS